MGRYTLGQPTTNQPTVGRYGLSDFVGEEPASTFSAPASPNSTPSVALTEGPVDWLGAAKKVGGFALDALNVPNKLLGAVGSATFRKGGESLLDYYARLPQATDLITEDLTKKGTQAFGSTAGKVLGTAGGLVAGFAIPAPIKGGGLTLGEGNVVKYFAKETNAEKVATVLKNTFKIADDVAADVAPKIASATKEPEVKALLAQLSGMGAATIPDVVGNIRLSKFNLQPEAKDELANIIRQNDEFLAQRRGTMSFKDTEVLASEVNPAKFANTLKPGKALNVEELQALGNQVAFSSVQLDDVSKRVASGANTDQDIAEFGLALTKEASLLASYTGATAEAGRALSILRNTRKAIDSTNIDLIREAARFLGGREKLEEIARRLVAFPDGDIIGKYNFVRSLQKPGAADWASWYWYSNLLSGPKTQVRNILGSVANITFGTATKPFAGAADLVRSTLTGTDREVFAGELPSEVIGMIGGIKTGWNKALHILRNGYSLDDVMNLDFRPPEVAGGVATNLIGRALDATDTFFRSISSQGELYAQAYTAARKKGLTGQAAADFMQDFISSPPVSVMKSIADFGSKSVFREKPGAITSALVKLKNDFTLSLPGGKSVKVFNPAKFVLPFVSTPANILKSSFEASPAGFFTGFFKDTARAQAQTWGKAALGSIALAPLALMASEGRVSGSGPKDRELRDLLYRSGWQPNSIKIGDKWYSYSNFQPLAFPLSIMANAYESWHYDGEEANVGSILAKVGNSVLQNSYLSGVASLQDALADPENFGKTFATRFLTSLVPLSSAQRQITQAADETIRSPATLGESLKASTPSLSDEVRPRLDVLGQESVRDTGLPQPAEFLARLFSPVDVRQVRETPLETELARLQDQVQIGFPAKSFTVNGRKVDLSPDEYNDLLKLSGEQVRTVLTKAIATDQWAKRRDDAKVEFIKRSIETAREQAKNKLIRSSDRIKGVIRAKPIR